MAELSLNSNLTLIELAKRSKNQNILAVAEVLDQTNDMLADAVWLPANGDYPYDGRTRCAEENTPTGSHKRTNTHG